MPNICPIFVWTPPQLSMDETCGPQESTLSPSRDLLPQEEGIQVATKACHLMQVDSISDKHSPAEHGAPVVASHGCYGGGLAPPQSQSQTTWGLQAGISGRLGLSPVIWRCVAWPIPSLLKLIGIYRLFACN